MAIVVGYPIQSDQQIDLMYEDECARLWEELNAPDKYDAQMKEAAKDFALAASKIDDAECELSAAVSDLFETPLRNVAEELLDRLMDFRYEVEALAAKYAKGER